MPSSSSSDEDLEKFKEAADSSLYNDSLFIKNEVLEQKSVSAVLPSLRYVEEEGGGGDQVYNKLHVTPAFQKHVANKLSKLFDSHLEIDGDTTVTSRNVLQATRRKPLCNSEDDSNRGGVRLFGASAVFLSSMNIVPLPPYKRGKRERKVASFTNGCDSSSDDSDNGNMLKMSAAAVSPSWVLSGEATKGWAHSKGKLERCKMDKAGCLIPISNGFEALDPDKSNTNFKESLNAEILSNLSSQNHRKKKKVFKIDTELAASFSSVVSIGSDSQCDTSSKPRKPEHKKKKKKKKKRSKEHYSEDAATETTEVEEAVERRKKKLKRAHKKTKYLRVVERVSEEIQMINECVPGLLEDENDIGSRRRQKKHKVKRLRATREYFLKSKRCCLHTPSKKKLRNNIRHLSDDLAKLMMTPSETSQD